MTSSTSSKRVERVTPRWSKSGARATSEFPASLCSANRADCLRSPIHVQQTYLDVELREQLRTEKGVVSWRIWQKPGQVVFIPAGFVLFLVP